MPEKSNGLFLRMLLKPRNILKSFASDEPIIPPQPFLPIEFWSKNSTVSIKIEKVIVL